MSEQKSPRTSARSGSRGLTAGVSAPNDNDVELAHF
jgi:hypothetical protein